MLCCVRRPASHAPSSIQSVASTRPRAQTWVPFPISSHARRARRARRPRAVPTPTPVPVSKSESAQEQRAAAAGSGTNVEAHDPWRSCMCTSFPAALPICSRVLTIPLWTGIPSCRQRERGQTPCACVRACVCAWARSKSCPLARFYFLSSELLGLLACGNKHRRAARSRRSGSTRAVCPCTIHFYILGLHRALRPPPPNPPILGALRLSTGCVGAIVLRSNAVIAVPPLLNMHTNRLALVSLLPGSSSAIGRGDPWDDDQLTHSLRPSFHVSCAACCASWQPSGPASPPRLEPAPAGMAVESVTTLPGPHKAISGLCWRRAPLGRKHKCPIPSRTRLNLSCPSGPAGCM